MPTLSFFGQAKQADELLRAELALPGQSELSTEQVKELVKSISLGYLQELMADEETFQARFGASIEDIYPEFFDTARSSLGDIAQSTLATLGLAEGMARDKGILHAIGAASAIALPKSNIVQAAYAALNPLTEGLKIDFGMSELVQQMTSINASVIEVANWIKPIALDLDGPFRAMMDLSLSVRTEIIIPKYDWIGAFERYDKEDREIKLALGIDSQSEEYQRFYGDMPMSMIRRSAEVAILIRSWLDDPRNDPETLEFEHKETYWAIREGVLHPKTVHRLQQEYSWKRKRQSMYRYTLPKSGKHILEIDMGDEEGEVEIYHSHGVIITPRKMLSHKEETQKPIQEQKETAPSVTTDPKLFKFKNDCHLSGREWEVFILWGQGLTERGIADKLCLSVATIKSHKKNGSLKIGVNQRELREKYRYLTSDEKHSYLK